MKATALTSILVSCIGLGAGAAQLSYTITELPVSDYAQPVSLAGLTERGATAGRMIDGYGWIVFLWTQDGAQVLARRSDVAGFFEVRGLNRREQVVGTFSRGVGQGNALLWSAGTTRYLGTLGGRHSAAYGINDHGDIVGASTVAGDNEWHAFLYRKGRMIDLGVFGARHTFASAINNKRQVVLELQDESANRLAIYEHGHLRVVGTLGNWTSGLAINEAGHVVGNCAGVEPTTAQGHAFYYDGRRLLDLRVTGELFSTSKSINNRDEIVGTWGTDSAGGGFLYRDGQRTDVSELLPPGSGWSILTAEHINDSGQIIGLGVYGGVSKFYVLTPAEPKEQRRGSGLWGSASVAP